MPARAGRQSLAREPTTGTDYFVYLPPAHATQRALWPLLLVLHGASDRGTEPLAMVAPTAAGLPVHRLRGGVPPVPVSTLELPRGVMDIPEALSTRFVVVSPQTAAPRWAPETVAKFTDALTSSPELRLDPARRHVAGAGMGGTGALAAAGTGRFASAVVICATGGGADTVPDAVDVWLVHGANDLVVDVRRSDGLFKALRARRASRSWAGDVRYSRLPEVPAPVGWPLYTGHAAWIPAFSDPALYEWMLRSKRM